MSPPTHLGDGPGTPAAPAEPTAGARRVLVVDDDPDQRELMRTVLSGAGLAVETASSGEEAVEVVRRTAPDLVTLDVSMPGMDGIEACRRIRSFSDAYVIMVTSRSAEMDRLLGLEVGADDYMVKPCSPRELVARASAVLRRPRGGVTVAGAPARPDAPGAPEPLERPGPPGTTGSPGPPEPEDADVAPGTRRLASVVDAGGGLVLHPVRHVALLDGAPLPLTPAEIDLLGALSCRPLRTWWRAELVREVWQGDFMESDFLVDVHVASLRRKLRHADPDRSWIRTVDGSGYHFVAGP